MQCLHVSVRMVSVVSRVMYTTSSSPLLCGWSKLGAAGASVLRFAHASACKGFLCHGIKSQ
jgi:hypothetical protein